MAVKMGAESPITWLEERRKERGRSGRKKEMYFTTCPSTAAKEESSAGSK
jgi:hypothetical protein